MISIFKIQLPFNRKHFKKFPHIKRSISALIPTGMVKSFFLFCLLTITVINLFYSFFSNPTIEENLKLSLMLNPQNSSLHERLGQYYVGINSQAAQKEYQLAEIYYIRNYHENSQVLGEQSSPWQTWLNLLSQKEKIRGEIKSWEKLQSLYPDYTYIQMKLAALYYLLGEKDKSREYLQKVLIEKPLDGSALKLAKELK